MGTIAIEDAVRDCNSWCWWQVAISDVVRATHNTMLVGNCDSCCKRYKVWQQLLWWFAGGL